MQHISVGKLGGICFIVGGILAFIPFLLQIIMGGPPQEGVHIFTDFANNVVAGGKLSMYYSLSSSIGFALLAYATYTLNSVLQKHESHAVMGLGAFLFIVAQLGFMVAWAMDLVILFGSEEFPVGNVFMISMALFFTFAPIGFLGGALFSYSLANRAYVHPLFLKASAIVFILTGLVFVYTLFTFTYYSAATILLMFGCVSVSQIVSIIWNILVGRKMMA